MITMITIIIIIIIIFIGTIKNPKSLNDNDLKIDQDLMKYFKNQIEVDPSETYGTYHHHHHHHHHHCYHYHHRNYYHYR